MENFEKDLSSFAFHIPKEKFLWKEGKYWGDQYVNKEGIINHLIETGWDPDTATQVIKSRCYLKVYGEDTAPGEADLFYRSGKRYINLWRAPELTPAPHPWPTIARVFSWITKDDAKGQYWLFNWIAAKVQQPTLVPKVAVVITSEQGAGKGIIALLMRQMLGEYNCATLTRGALESKFNARWINKLFVLADEVMTSDNLKDISDLLKVLIDGAEVEREGKGTNQEAVRNKLAWLFASNDKVAPVVLEQGDRRYSVFSNHSPIPQDYRDLLNSCFESDRVTPTPWFKEEIQGFYHDLLAIVPDRELIAKPYANEAREALIAANLPAHELFFKEVDENGVDGYLQNAANRDINLQRTRSEWDFGEDGVSTEALYLAYVEFCKQTGMRALKLNKFGAAINNRAHPWQKVRRAVGNKRINCYIAPRSKK